MNRDDIIRMAQEAGFEIEKTLYGPVPCVDGRGIDDRLERFAALVAEREREACAKVAEAYEPTCDTCPSGVANAIRVRSET